MLKEVVMEGRGYEKLVALYLRLNGYFIVENFIVHPQDRGPQRGEIDVFGVRFPHQAEKLGETVMIPDPKLVQLGHNCIDVVLAAVTRRRRLRPNRGWLKPVVLEYILRFVGFTPHDEELSKVAKSLLEHGNAKSEDNKFSFQIVKFSQRQNGTSNAKPIRLDDVLQWIVEERFHDFASIKADISQWDNTTLQGHLLRQLSTGERPSLDDIRKWGQKMTEIAQSALITSRSGSKV